MVRAPELGASEPGAISSGSPSRNCQGAPVRSPESQSRNSATVICRDGILSALDMEGPRALSASRPQARLRASPGPTLTRRAWRADLSRFAGEVEGYAALCRSRRNWKNSTPSRSRRFIICGLRTISPTMEAIFGARK